LCWRNSYWTSTDAVPGCDGELIPPVSKAIAPAIETGRLIATPPIQTIPVPTPPTPCDFSASLQNDQTFAFNNAVLSSAAKLALKHLITEKFAACTSIESVRITGYSDRLGSTKYNQQLSEQRAAAVAAYLRSNNITAQIVVYGAGQTQQIVACDDKMRPAQLVQCLAPNRRVVLEVKGSTR
jgi:OOP family OmpA-OmpF porin